jgi:novel plant SNARE
VGGGFGWGCGWGASTRRSWGGRYKRSFKTESDALPAAAQERLEERFRALQNKYRTVREDYQALGLAETTARDDLMDGGAGAGSGLDVDRATNTELLDAAHAQEEDNTSKLDEALTEISNAVELGAAAAGKLSDQGKVLEKTKTELVEIQSELEISKRLISTFTRRLFTDKIIICMIFLVLVVVVAIIVFSTLDPKHSPFQVPEEAKPPTKPSDFNNRRLLRGEW